MSKNNSKPNTNYGIEGRLDAIISLMVALLPKNDNSLVDKTKVKAAAALLKANISKDDSAKLLGMDNHKLTKIPKK